MKPRHTAIAVIIGILLGAALAIAQELSQPANPIPNALLLQGGLDMGANAPPLAANHFGWKETAYGNSYAWGIYNLEWNIYLANTQAYFELMYNKPSENAGGSPDSQANVAFSTQGVGYLNQLKLGFTGGATGDQAMSHTPALIWSSFSAGTPPQNSYVGGWKPQNSVTLVAIDSLSITPPNGCTTNQVFTVWDNTLSSSLGTITNSTQFNHATLSANVLGGHQISVYESTAPAGCTTTPANCNIAVTYNMQ